LITCAFTTPLTERVTVAVCGELVPTIAVTVITSPATLMLKGNSAGLAAVVTHNWPVVVFSPIDVAELVTAAFSTVLEASARGTKSSELAYGSRYGPAGVVFSVRVHRYLPSVSV
jgi:hypothetical protein